MARSKTPPLKNSQSRDPSVTSRGKSQVKDVDEHSSVPFITSPVPIVTVVVAALIFLAFRDTIAWNWHATGVYIEYQWNRLVDNYGQNERLFWVVGTVTYTAALYWTVGLLFTFLDWTNKPLFFRKYKTQPGVNEPVEMKKLFKVAFQVIFNQTVVSIPLTYIGGILQENRHPPLREVPTFFRIFTDFIVLILVYEVVFYYSHRTLHHPILYKYIHKKHHEWTSPIAIAAIYCHPFEHVFSNLLPQVVGLSIMRSHIFTAWLWFTYAILVTLSDHSGYHLPLLPSPEFHDYHHLKFNNCFGTFGFLDWLHGTDTKFRKSVQFERHQRLMGLKPVRELCSQDSKKN